MKTYKVIRPYVTLRARNELGQEVVLGFYEGANLPEGANQEDVERLARKGMVAEEGSREADLLAVPAGTPVPGEPPNVPVTEASGAVPSVEERMRRAQEAADRAAADGDRRDGRPSVRASKEDWVEHAVTRRADGTSEDDARAEAQGMSKAELVAKFGG